MLETVKYRLIRLKNPRIWKIKYDDEVYLYDWIQDKQNAKDIFEIACDDIAYIVSLLSNKPSPATQFHWLIIKLMKYVYALDVSAPEENFAICFTQNGYKQSMWESYADEESFVCYETNADYFQKMAIPRLVNLNSIFHSSHCDLWKMNYCTPDICVREFIRDNDNTIKINNAFYLKDILLSKEQEVRLNYSISTDKNLYNFKMDSRFELEKKLKSQKTSIKIKEVFVEYLTNFTYEYTNFLQHNKDRVNPILLEDQIYLELPTKINEYILSIQTSPKAPTEWLNFIQNLCRYENIKFKACGTC